jgi:hypothetical protein
VLESALHCHYVRRNDAAQVMPFHVGAHPAMDSNFTNLEFNDATPRLVYVEGLVGNPYLNRSKDVMRYKQIFEHMRELILSPQESVKLIATVAPHTAA